MIRATLLTIVAVFAGCSLATAQQPQKDAKFSLFEMAQVTRVLNGTAGDEAKHVASATVGKKIYPVLNIEFTSAKACAAFEAKGLFIFNRFKEFADAFLLAEEGRTALIRSDDVKWFERGGTAIVPPPPIGMPGEKVRDRPETVVRDGVGTLKGQGIVIAVIDTGIDFHHDDFIRKDAEGRPTSRILYYWDTLGAGPAEGKPGSKAPVTYPDGDSVGTIYNQQELTKELRTKKGLITVKDTDGHGTACASVAAGNGNAADKESRKDRIGVAPEADLIAVRIGTEEGLPNAYLLNSICGWIEKVAGDRPVVISCSFGGQYGGHDGSRVAERQLDKRFPNDLKSRAICIAAGNEGRFALHAAVEFGGESAKAELTWTSTGEGVIEIYCDSVAPDDIVISGSNKRYIQFNPLAQTVVCQVLIDSSKADANTGLLKPDRIELSTRSGKKVKADAFLPGLPAKAYFTDTCAVYGKQISSPATTTGVITVGSYDWNNQFHEKGKLFDFDVNIGKNGSRQRAPFRVGVLSAYSNPGPSRQGKTIKPNVVAPGWFWSASAPPNVKVDYDTSGRYQRFDGTSAATPYAAGVVALMLQKKPSLTFGEIKNLLHANASRDYPDARDDGKPESNPGWGYGKLDKKAVEKILNEIR